MKQDTKAFDTAYKALNKAQKLAVDTIEGPVMVMAGPGTGKTQILSLRIAIILKNTDIPPDAILALTFTDSGCRAMRKRLTSLIGSEAYRVGIFTFHKYATNVIAQHPDYFPRIIGAKPADEVDTYEVIKDAIEKSGVDTLSPSGDPEYYIRPISRLISTLKSDAVSAEMYASYIDKEDGPDAFDKKGEPSSKLLRSKDFVTVFRAYETLMREKKLYDFNDMLIELINALQTNEDLRLELSESAQYILADEHQDANLAQNRILELLTTVHDEPNLFIVGDDKQAVYRFQGASLENFLYFKEKYKNAVIISLTDNYRSTQAIIDASAELMEGKSASDAKLTSIGETGKPIEIVAMQTEEDELQEIAHRIEALIKNGIQPDDIAILVRKNNDIDALMRILRIRKIPFLSFRDSDALAQPAVVLLLALLKSVQNPHDSSALSRSLLLPAFKISTLKLSAIFEAHRRTYRPVFELIADDDECAVAFSFYEKMTREALEKPILPLLDAIVTESGYLSHTLSAVSLSDALEAFRAVRELIVARAERDPLYMLEDAQKLISSLEKGIAQIRFGTVSKGAGVTLMTLHKSKGLEFDHVFVPFAVESRFEARKDRQLFLLPPFVNKPEPDTEDERRLLYVGITRAKKHVVVTHHAFRSNEREEAPSQFLFSFSNAERIHHDTRSDVMLVPTQGAEIAKETLAEYVTLIEKFFESGISATALNNYIQDPWECFFRNILRLPETKVAHQMYGTAVHYALEQFYTALSEGNSPESSMLTDAFIQALSREPLAKKERKVLEEKGKEALEGYFACYNGTFPKAGKTELSMKVDLPLDGIEREHVHLTGFLDRVDVSDGTRVHVTDYKTGKPKSRNDIEGKTQSGDGAYKRQLVFYKILLDVDGRYDMLDATIDFIEPNASGAYKRETFQITDEEKTELIKQITTMVCELTSGAMLHKPCESKDEQIRAFAEIISKRFVTQKTS